MRPAVTLIEMLVVITILALLSTMVLSADFGDTEETLVRQAAVDLRNNLLKARSLSLRTQTTYSLSFNIATPAGNKVLQNFTETDGDSFPGRHWYTIVAPCDKDDTNQYQNMWLPPLYGRSAIGGANNDEKLGNMRKLVRRLQVNGRTYLPRGTRFLALSDLDGGFGYAKFRNDRGCWARSSRCMIYPLPWFGRLINRGPHYRLFTWGFYESSGNRVDDPDVHRGVLAGTLSNYWLDNSIAHSAFKPQSYPYFEANGNWNIAEAETMDAYLYFKPDGAAGWSHSYSSKANINYNWYPSRDRMGWSSQHETAAHGGFIFTICRDVDPDDEIYPNPGEYHYFANERDALSSIVPFMRVMVDKHSGVSTLLPGLTGVPEDLYWTNEDGTVNEIEEMSPLWRSVDPHCRVQQNQKIHEKMTTTDEAVEHAKSYHLPDSDFVRFRRASSEAWSGAW